MAQYLTDDAFCLRVSDFSETSQIALLFTAQHGLLPLIAKGAKRPGKKSSGPLDLLARGEAVFIPAKATAELGMLTSWELVDYHPALRTGLPGLNAAMLCVEITLSLVLAHDPHPGLFTELAATLELLPTPERPRALVAYAKAALTAAGYQPHLDACVECGRGIGPEQTARFSPAAGGAVCTECRVSGRTLSVPGKILMALDRLPPPTQLQASPPERAADPAALRTALELLLLQVEALRDRAVKTRWLIPSIFA